MTIEIKVPVLPESVADALVAKWYIREGESVQRDQQLVDLETDKVMLEVPALSTGVITKIYIKEGEKVKAGTVLGILTEGAAAATTTKPAAQTKKPTEPEAETAELSPAVRRLVAEHNLDTQQIKPTGKGGRLTKEDVENYLQSQAAPKEKTSKTAEKPAVVMGNREEKRVPMSRLRARIAERLVAVKQETAMLTTFNEVDMHAVMDLRQTYKDHFEKKHQARLGLMSFFVKAAVEALKRFPMVNASIDGENIVYHNYFDIGIAVGGGPRGLVVPILRDADQMIMADIEKNIRDLADKVKNNKITLEELTGGTFTITNGGVYGSLLSTPIINPPQSAILGMHKIAERPVVINGEIKIRPIMYLALSYDHRIIDGTESVQFLVTIKELLEDPARFLLHI